MTSLIVLYKMPEDPAAFDTHYAETHIPLAKKIPGLRKLEISHGPVMTPAGPSSVHQVAILSFDDLAAFQAGLTSPEGQAAGADAASLGITPLDMLIFDTQEV